MTQGSEFFEGGGAVQESLRRITQRLDELAIPYAVSGGMALFAHGYRRFTEDVDILVTPQSLSRVHQALEGLGYVHPFQGSKNLRDTQSRVRIDFLLTGHYPGDGKPKEVQFPDPAKVAVEIDGIKYLSLPTLIDLKLASGMTAPDRLKDLTDVVELIKLLELPATFSEQLSPSVRKKFAELHRSTQARPRRFLTLWRNKFPTPRATSIEQLASSMPESAALLQAMAADGVTLDPNGGTGDAYAYLVTTDPAIAKKYDMHDESEFWGDDGDAA